MSYKNIDNIIVNTACSLFAEKGYDNVSVNEICSACGITKPTFYYHFHAKEDILFAYYGDALKNVPKGIRELPYEMSGFDRVIAAFDIIFDTYIELGYDFLQGIILGSLKNIEHVLTFPDELSAEILHQIKKGQRDGSINSAHSSDILLASCCHAFLGYTLFWCQRNGITTEFHTLLDVLTPILTKH